MIMKHRFVVQPIAASGVGLSSTGNSVTTASITTGTTTTTTTTAGSHTGNVVIPTPTLLHFNHTNTPTTTNNNYNNSNNNNTHSNKAKTILSLRKNKKTMMMKLKNYCLHNKNDPIIVAIVITFIVTTFSVTILMTLLFTAMKTTPSRTRNNVKNYSNNHNNNNNNNYISSSSSSSSWKDTLGFLYQFPITFGHNVVDSITDDKRIDEKNSNNNNNDDEEEDIFIQKQFKVLPHNKLYRIPESMERFGDRSTRYVQLRYKYDMELLPINFTRSQNAVQLLQQQKVKQYRVADERTTNVQSGGGVGVGVGVGIDSTASTSTILANSRDSVLQAVPITVHHSDTIPYDIYDCPDQPPNGYPFQWNIMDVLNNWGPDNVTIPESGLLYQGLCVFDYSKDYNKARTYRDLEVPFVVVNDPDVARTVERWNSPGYMEQMLGTVQHRTEYSENNHFMYYVPVNHLRKQRRNLNRVQMGAPDGWKQPTTSMRMSYKEWIQHANLTATKTRTGGPNEPHWYFRLIGCGLMGNDGSCDKGSSEYLYDELPFFQPKKSSLYVVEPSEQKGIHCRFGMKGVIAENHFDGSRNSIAVLAGTRRYILTHPNQCTKLALYPKGHPSARHSAVDWSQPDLNLYPEFAEATANEVLLQPGQVLYLPTDWFHYIISLELNFQCNTRSGITDHFKEDLRLCGF